MANLPKLNPKHFLGQKVLTAMGEMLQNGIMTRIVSEDGRALPLTEDYVPNRWDLEVERGFVTGIRIPDSPRSEIEDEDDSNESA
jgi:hypothetical protein